MAELTMLLTAVPLAWAVLLLGVLLSATAIWMLIRQLREQRSRRRIDAMLQELAERR